MSWGESDSIIFCGVREGGECVEGTRLYTYSLLEAAKATAMCSVFVGKTKCSLRGTDQSICCPRSEPYVLGPEIKAKKNS